MSTSKLDLLIAEAHKPLNRPVLVAVDGRSGTGKSTLAAEVAARHGGRCVTADDFWSGGEEDYWQALPPDERADRAIDWRRLRAEVLEPLLAGCPASWRTFNWQVGEGLSDSSLACEPVPVIVLDGAYSMRPELADIVDVAVLVTLDDPERRSRLLAREGDEFMGRWHVLWDKTEDYYFTTVRPPNVFDVVIAMA